MFNSVKTRFAQRSKFSTSQAMLG